MIIQWENADKDRQVGAKIKPNSSHLNNSSKITVGHDEKQFVSKLCKEAYLTINKWIETTYASYLALIEAAPNSLSTRPQASRTMHK